MLPTAEETANLQEIEMQWAVKAMTHAEVYMGILKAKPAKNIKLTQMDEDIYVDFRTEFPTLNIKNLNELEDFKSEAAKKKWRDFVAKYENYITDYNFGSLVRINSDEEYTEKNSMFVLRIQFLCIEIARLKEGYNNGFYEPSN
ncbi:hypothetical protein BB561_004917 [Smittium simulii]|uniref:Polysaccharide biosynthesis domain-containing protein n=1 Tax=Smittium simulii TaxID=133385 RepID=A0A2T9YDF4_9FUNG|nr:hypothetical protein BB561_004917 [Smittium simulii]